MLDLGPLLERAFLEGEALQANQLINDARIRFAELAPAAIESFSYEVLVPEAPELEWLQTALLPRLVYHCETRRAPLPGCGGVFVSAFVGERLFCVAASEVIAFAAERLELGWEVLVERHGTGEVRHALNQEEDDDGAEIQGLLPGPRA